MAFQSGMEVKSMVLEEEEEEEEDWEEDWEEGEDEDWLE